MDEYGVNLTGSRLNTVMAETDGADQILEIFQTCHRTASPVYYDVRYLSLEETPRACTGILLPLFDDEGRVAHLLGCSQWTDAVREAAPDKNAASPASRHTANS